MAAEGAADDRVPGFVQKDMVALLPAGGTDEDDSHFIWMGISP
jgi:hypothetical protein